MIDEKKARKRNKNAPKPEYKNLNPFKAAEKHYKLYQGQATDFSTLFQPQENDFKVVNGYEVCELPFPQGAYYVKNFNDLHQAAEIGWFGLNVYCQKPYRTNLDSPADLYEKQEKLQSAEKHQPTAITSLCEKQEKVQSAEKPQPTTITQKQEKSDYYFNEKIRWANVGYQYDWTQRKYPEKKSPIHASIRWLSNRANQLFNLIEESSTEYEPESAIINYYGKKDYMTGHLDDAEIDQTSPIYSFSFGLSCVFLIGGRTREEKPTSIRLNSGDLLIMSGESRKCYHGVPRIMDGTFQAGELPLLNQNFLASMQQAEQAYKNGEEEVKSYLETHRININIRQVYPRQKMIE